MSFTTPEHPTQGQDQAAPDPTAAAPSPAPAAPTPAGAGPWATDLAQRFQDESTRGAVDQFIREKVQPYTTQLEQKAAASEDALRLWTAFEQNPLDAYVAVTTDMFGEDAGAQMLTYLQQQVDKETAEGATAEEAVQTVAQDPRVASAIEWAESQQAEKAYDTELGRIKAAHPEVDEDAFHTFVAGAEGNFDMAYQLYSQFVEKFGPPQTVPEPEPAPEAAPVLGSDTATGQASTTQVQPNGQTIGGAIQDMMNDFRAAREAPPVGSA